MNIGDWMETPNGGRITGYAFGFGAAIVIVGALFKIQHWPGASLLLTAGMGTEAVLFMITAFGNPHKTYHWEAAFPQLNEESDLEGITSFGGGGGGNGTGSGTAAVSGGSSVASLEGVPALSEDDVKKLSDGILRLTDSASKIADLTNLKSAADKLTNNLSDASDSVGSFVSTQNAINESSSSLVDSYKSISIKISGVSQSTETFIGTMDGINKNLSSINAVYELQLQTVNAQVKSIQSVEAEWSQIKNTVSGALAASEAYKNESVKLSQQVANLNNVYGSMLNALSVN